MNKMNWSTAVISVLLPAFSLALEASAGPLCERAGRPVAASTCLQSAQFDTDDDGVAGCVNQCKLDLEICLGTRPEGEPPDRCENQEDTCENGCYNTGPDAGSTNQ
jgi:hypothetical protein